LGIAAIVKKAFPPKKNIAKIDVNTNLGGGAPNSPSLTQSG